jgi:hypothetical protein
VTREEFVCRWRNHLAGMALYGAVSELRDGPLMRASRVLDIPSAVESLLGRLYDDATRSEPATRPAQANGNQVRR